LDRAAPIGSQRAGAGGPPAWAQLNGTTLTFGLMEVLGRDIVHGKYDGQPFPNELALGVDYAVSRTVVRETVKMLVARGILASASRRGTFVQPREAWNVLDPDVLRWLLDRARSGDWLRQFTQLRLAIEPLAAALAALQAKPAQIAAIGDSLEQMRLAQLEGDALAADTGFHFAVIEASNNPFLDQFRRATSSGLGRAIRLTGALAITPTDIAQHERVHAAIAARDPALAQAAMRVIIEAALARF
jgi:DNA-binding FadR family transcriptional regulator